MQGPESLALPKFSVFRGNFSNSFHESRKTRFRIRLRIKGTVKISGKSLTRLLCLQTLSHRTDGAYWRMFLEASPQFSFQMRRNTGSHNICVCPRSDLRATAAWKYFGSVPSNTRNCGIGKRTHCDLQTRSFRTVFQTGSPCRWIRPPKDHYWTAWILKVTAHFLKRKIALEQMKHSQK